MRRLLRRPENEYAGTRTPRGRLLLFIFVWSWFEPFYAPVVNDLGSPSDKLCPEPLRNSANMTLSVTSLRGESTPSPIRRSKLEKVS